LALGLDQSVSEESAATPRVMRASFGDFDEISDSIPDFDSEYVPLAQGSVAMSSLRVALDRLTLTRFDENNPAYAFHATAPEGALTLALAASLPTDAVWRGAPLAERTLLLYGPNGEHVAHSRGTLHCLTLHVAEGALERHAERLGFDLAVAPGAVHALEPPAEAIQGLRHAAEQVLATAQSADALLDVAEVRRTHEDALLTAAVHAIQPDFRRGEESPTSQARAASRAVAALEARADETLYVADLCEAAGVSERTLRNAFQRTFGVSPIRYLQQHRMSRIRRLLLTAEPSRDRVSTIAQRFGFTNLGRFAVEFRRLYGVSPSALLRR